MGKIQDYEFYRLPQEVIDFKDDVTTLINFGKFAVGVSNSPPAYAAGEGEMFMLADGPTRRFYVFVSGTWNFVEWGGTGTSAVSTRIISIDLQTSVETDRNIGEGITRFRAGGVESVIVTDTYISSTAGNLLDLGQPTTPWKNLWVTGTGFLDNVEVNLSLTMSNGANIIMDTNVGTQIATATNQLLSFWGATPIPQLATVVTSTVQDLSGIDTIDETKTEADIALLSITVNSILSSLQAVGIMA